MKLKTSLKSIAIFITVSVFLASCSHSRYSYLERASEKQPAVATVKTKAPSTPVSAVEKKHELNLSQPEVTATVNELKTFTIAKADKNVALNVVKKKMISKVISNAVKGKAIASPSVTNTFVKAVKSHTGMADVPVWLLYVIAVLWPTLAVALVTDWDWEIIVYNLLWCLLCWLPGIIHAFIVVARES